MIDGSPANLFKENNSRKNGRGVGAEFRGQFRKFELIFLNFNV